MTERIDRARRDRDTLGGIFEVQALSVPIGLGSYVQWDRKLDGRLAQAVIVFRQSKEWRSAAASRTPEHRDAGP
jgi:chorismate synthase